MREPNSVGFWRRNTIAGLQMSLPGPASWPAPDPEALEEDNRRLAELKDLIAQEQKVKERLERICRRRS